MTQRRLGKPRSVPYSLLFFAVFGVSTVGNEGPAAAQGQDPPKPGDAQSKGEGDKPGAGEVDPDAMPDAVATDPEAKGILDDDRPDILAEALKPVAHGLQPREVARLAAESSRSVAVTRAEARAAAAKVDRAIAAYFPVLTLSASYTRVSEHPVDFGIDIPGMDIGSFDAVPDSYALTAGLAVPISDYILRLSQAYATVSLEEDAKKLEVQAGEQQAAMQSQVAYFNWIRVQGVIAVADRSVELLERHLEDAKAIHRGGLIARADVLRIEAELANRQHEVRSAHAGQNVVAEQLRTLMHVKPETPLAIGIDVIEQAPKGESRKLPELIQIALTNRPELKALDKTHKSLREASSVLRAGYYPRLDAFANTMYANPNPRIFPQTEKWDLTWDVGLRVSWRVNDTFTTMGHVREMEATATKVKQSRKALEDGIRLATTAAYYDMEKALSAIEAANKNKEVAELALDDRRRLFRGGKATSTDMVDAEHLLTATRLGRLDAYINLLVARAQLDLALGKPLK
ncbi:MAG: TolC family protein [Deltaproteobacteria bacterium]|nr:TolC family protein [Deltaproteobacteria bacterium]